MNPIDKRTLKFIQEHHILTIATSNNNNPYCATCFYIFLEDLNMFVFTSDENTKHINDIEKQKSVAGAIALETKIIGKIRGIQFTGIINKLKGEEQKTAKRAYLKAFPYAILMQTHLWGVEVDFIKMTDNRLGFGKKIIWKKV
ncbi:MAG: pyridoxamine 5'-phosphate oxidase family protein [Bacteroidales bacterium]|nr:pyridoxamine 5'-phosphate oxidase family protein [Bacteroidales bacterium]